MATSYAKRVFEIIRKEGYAHYLKNFVSLPNRVGNRIGRTTTFSFRSYRNHISNKISYDAPAETFTPLWINPRMIEYRRELPSLEYGLGTVKPGDWDSTNLTPVEEYWKTKGLRSRFEEDNDWEETIYWDQYLRKMDGNEQKVKNRCEKTDNLYCRLRSDGYVSDYSTGKVLQPLGDQLEIVVSIGRDGSIFHQGKGGHRLVFGKLLNIDICAHVLCRHKQWQELRDEIHKNGLSEEYKQLRDHPDLQDILD